jgi:Rrf2 family protein
MLSQAVGYAASALGCVAAMGGKPALVREIAQACGIPAPYLAKIVNTLARKGILQTQRGVRGGVSLSRDAKDLTLHDICVALGDPVVQNRCMLSAVRCTDARGCPAHCFWKEHRDREVAFLKRTTVADIAAFETRRRWARSKPQKAVAGR